jgi:hypothetical protein
MAERKNAIFEYIDNEHRLGRHVRHDGRSLAYPAKADGTKATARWERAVPVFDQGDLGSCTGNAAAGVMGTQPFYDTIKTLNDDFDEDFAVKIYEAATRLDDFPGQYQPTDTGSTGLAAAKALKNLGLISGYTHILSIDAAYTAIQAGPFILGSNWLSGMDTPDDNGLVKVKGYVRGGHEYAIVGFDATKNLWEAVNSWGPDWGKGGHFFITDAGFRSLLADEGDATVFTPITAPAPQPQPIVNPTPTPDPTPEEPTDTPSAADLTLWDAQSTWVKGSHTSKATRALAQDLTEWAEAKGLS